jgi:hypothetical protein
LAGRNFSVGVRIGCILAENRAEVTKEHRLSPAATARQVADSRFSQAGCLDAFVEILLFSVLPESCCL